MAVLPFNITTLGLGEKRGLRTALQTAECGHENKKIPFMSALVENADTLENTQNMRKNVRIRKFLTFPHFLDHILFTLLAIYDLKDYTMNCM